MEHNRMMRAHGLATVVNDYELPELTMYDKFRIVVRKHVAQEKLKNESARLKEERAQEAAAIKSPFKSKFDDDRGALSDDAEPTRRRASTVVSPLANINAQRKTINPLSSLRRSPTLAPT
jgi:hypothetical protein